MGSPTVGEEVVATLEYHGTALKENSEEMNAPFPQGVIMEQTKKDMAIIGLADALRFAKNELSAWEMSNTIAKGFDGDKEYIRQVHGLLVNQII